MAGAKLHAAGIMLGSLLIANGTHATGDGVTNPDNLSGMVATGFTRTSVNPDAADLSISEQGSFSPVSVGSTLTYTLTVTNSGPGIATGVIVIDPLPPGLMYVSATSTQGTRSVNGNSVTARIGSMSSGSTVTVTATATATGVGRVANTATVSGGESDPDITNNSATVMTYLTGHTGAIADLFLSNRTMTDPASVGSELTYIIAVVNTGPHRANDVDVTDLLPAGVTFVSASTSQGSWSLEGGTVTSRLGSIDKGGFAIVTAVVIPTTAGKLTSTASAFGSDTDPNTADNSATTMTAVETGGGSGADLIGIWKEVKRIGSNTVSGRFTPRNTGVDSAGAFTVKFYYSSDGTVDSTDKLIRTSTVADGLAAGASGAPIKVSYTGRTAVAGTYLIAVVDAGSTVGELNETNNTIVKQIP